MKILGINPKGVFIKENVFSGFPILFIGNPFLSYLVYQYICYD